MAAVSHTTIKAENEQNGHKERLGGKFGSHNELHAFASMVMAGLPFPPLPVMVRQGDGEYAIASSFDLLQQAIVAQQVALMIGTKHASNIENHLSKPRRT